MASEGKREASLDMGDERQGFVHCALLYGSERECRDHVVDFAAEGLTLGEPVLVAMPEDNLATLRDELCGGPGASPSGLRLVDIAELARNPGRFLALSSSFAEEHPDRRVRIVSQVAWPGRTPEEFVACTQHEALANVALEGRPVTGLCLYDAGRLHDDILASARATHPLLWRYGALHPSTEYAPDVALASCNQPLTANPGAVTYTVRKSEDLRPARSFAVDYASWVGLSGDALEDLQLVATELATNSLMYADGVCRLSFWREADHLVCEARDGGRLDDPLAGLLNPGSAGPASRGLFLVNAVSELVRTHTAATGTTIRAYLRCEPSPRS
ncbi:anti-sigma factor RsbA family regulatory protein [Mycobacterium sp. Lab-001]|uniref:anti-sigma factor RsbA family regulatory protein n=2 Tax=unclassified Mycobacterium TaxID=2642494 RepID=UPI003D16F492